MARCGGKGSGYFSDRPATAAADREQALGGEVMLEVGDGLQPREANRVARSFREYAEIHDDAGLTPQ